MNQTRAADLELFAGIAQGPDLEAPNDAPFFRRGPEFHGE